MNQLPRTVTSLIDAAINRYLALDPGSPAKIAALDGKVLEVMLKELDVPLYLRVSEQHVDVLPGCEDTVHSTMRASIISLIKMGLSQDSGEGVIGADIDMSGDMETGRRFHDLLKNADIDWEEILAQYTGDILAHKIGNSVRAVSRWGQNTIDTLSRDLSEYLQEESRQLPSRNEIAQYLENVDRLRLSVDRAEARIRQLQKTHSEREAEKHQRPDQ